MPQPLKAEDIDSKTDPTVARQWDAETPKKEQIDDFYKIVGSLNTCLLCTNRPGVGPVGRSMAIAKRDGPDFYFLANNNSQKFQDIDNDKTALITFQNSSNQDWVSITGEVTVTSNDESRVKEFYHKGTNAWFGDLGDGVHNGGPEDPRMAIIGVKANYIAYWKHTVTSIGFLKEVTQASLTGQVADTGLLRQFTEEDIKGMREYSK
ncbi:MAG: hypothetical protein HETSPECPRED_006731 [Heterodermia speciosa]|uniref:General stress protein FMN-binding split barrel domain-containing protein n=1 Tax=Heterodermia speciosa TaxID=116794 RepID=A0A8H3FS08_9LECA|nr:MAG: hypothetical protein HETSPECPRED_006731 [Heterodermia speciosa]